MPATSHYSVKHFSMLRHAIMKRQSGELRYVTRDGFPGCIALSEGEVLSSTKEHEVERFFADTMLQLQWHERQGRDAMMERRSLQMLLQGVEKMPLKPENMGAMRTLFAKLPRVTVRSVDVRFPDYRDDLCFHLLCNQAMRSSDFTVSRFLEQVDNEITLRQRLKVVVFAYCLGLLVPVAATSSSVRQRMPSAHVGLLMRIFGRVEAI